jgi:hypothetical protein
MDEKVIDAIIDGRLFLADNGCVLTADEVFFGYHSETDFSMDHLDCQDDDI